MDVYYNQEVKMLTRAKFGEVGTSQGRIPAVIGKAWNRTVRTALNVTIDGRNPGQSDRRVLDSVSFGKVMGAVRYIETGQHWRMMFGQTEWDIITEINNRTLDASDPGYLIPWTDFIHPQFNNGEDRRLRAAERLQEAYAQLSGFEVSRS